MLSIHLPTLFAFTMLQSICLGGLLIWLWRRDRSQPALASWGTGRLIGAVALPLLAARGVIPAWGSIDLANALVCLGYGLTWAGARQFEGLPARPLSVMAGAAVWLLACQVPGFVTSLQARVTLLGLIVAAYLVATAVEFHRGQARSPLPSRPILLVLLGTVAVIYGSCGPLAIVFPPKENSVGLPTSLWFGLVVSLGIVLMAGTSILLVALTKEQAELRSTNALAAARDIANEASEQKTRFLARMSHELRTPLNGILGLAQVLANDPEQGERQRKQAATLEQAGRHLLAILNEVLDLSRIEAGKLVLAPQPTDLVAFLNETLVFVQDDAGSKSIGLTLRTTPDLPETVLIDSMRLRQILLNLLNNALKFTPAGGHVTLEATCGAGETVNMAVTDTGPGVSASLRPHLFQAYVQGSGHEASGGSGLGLAISAVLADAMGGDLSHTDGEGGTGSRFILILPVPAVAPAVIPSLTKPSLPPPSLPPPSLPPPSLPPPSLPPLSLHLGGLRILVVDDVALNRMTARALLVHAGHVVEEAEDGPAALAAMARPPLPDVVLMDQSMPGMDGNTVVRHIRAMPGAAGQVPVLAVTANAMPEDIEASLAAGMDGYVVKPIELKLLLAAIAGAVNPTRLTGPAQDIGSMPGRIDRSDAANLAPRVRSSDVVSASDCQSRPLDRRAIGQRRVQPVARAAPIDSDRLRGK